MIPSRNFILFVCVMLFLAWYVSSWAYQTYYLEPRQKLGDEIAQLSGEIQTGRNNLESMKQFFEQNQWFYARSLPRIPNDARSLPRIPDDAQSLYYFWLLELLQYSGFENSTISNSQPAMLPSYGRGDYRFTVQCTGSLSQLSYFLFEFYYAPFLHRITSMTLAPVESDAEKLSFLLTVNALALRPHKPDDFYPANQVPAGSYPRLASNDLTVYQTTIAERNLLQTAKGGIDKADYTVLTAIHPIGNPPEVWFSIQTDDSVVKAKLGDSIHAGSFSGKVVEIFDQDIVLDRDGSRWLLTIGESLQEAFALPPETAERND